MRQFLLAMTLVALSCSAPTVTPVLNTDSASMMTFICIDDVSGELMGPLDGCGCNRWDSEENRFIRMGRVECFCENASGTPVSRIRAVNCAEGLCPAVDEDGRWLEASAEDVSIACEPQVNGKAAVAATSSQTGDVNVVVLRQREESRERVLDLDRTIPSLTGHYLGELVVETFYLPNQRLYGALTFPSGRLSLFENVYTVTADRSVALSGGPSVRAAFQFDWQSNFDSEQYLATLTVDGARIYEYRLSGLGMTTEGQTLEHGRCYSIDLDDGSGCVPLELGSVEARFVDLRYSANGEQLFVLRDDGELQMIDRAGSVNRLPPAPPVVDGCEDSYLSFAEDGECYRYSECFDGLDNDGDGLVDSNDPECDGERVFEGEASACNDGLDNDGDGSIDRADSGCRNILDRSELLFEEGALCSDGLDNDLNGLVDDNDPNCFQTEISLPFDISRRARCSDGLDNDGDGRIDFEGGDPACASAGSDAEGARTKSYWSSILAIGADARFGNESHFVSLSRSDGQSSLTWINESRSAGTFIFEGEAIQRVASREFGMGTGTEWYTIDGSNRLTEQVILDTLPVSFMGKPLYAQLPAILVENEDMKERATQGGALWVESLLIIEDGIAKSHESLRPACMVPSCVVAEDCNAGHLCEDGVCLPARCDTENCSGASTCGGASLCEAACLSNVQCKHGFRCVDGVCVSPCAIDDAGNIAITEIDETLNAAAGLSSDSFETIDLFSSGRHAFKVVKQQASLNLVNDLGAVSAFEATPILTGEPAFYLSNRLTQMNPNSSPYLCAVEAFGTTYFESDLGTCLPADYEERGGAFERKVKTDVESADSPSLRTYEHALLHEDSFDDLQGATTDAYQIRYEGTLPQSESKFGIHGGVDGDTWRLVDGKADFCAIGVEVGDVVNIERFRAGIDDSADCLPWVAPSLIGAADQRREPLRYRIAEVSPNQLRLETDGRNEYSQRPRIIGLPEPRPAAALGPPPVECVEQGFAYQIRVRDSEWIVTSFLSGYPHWWRADGDRCVRDERLNPPGRTLINEPYLGDRIRFMLGAPEVDEELCPSVGERCLPYLIDAEFRIGLASNQQRKSIQLSSRSIGAFEWSPFDDRLYLMDPNQGVWLSIGGLGRNQSFFSSRDWFR